MFKFKKLTPKRLRSASTFTDPIDSFDKFEAFVHSQNIAVEMLRCGQVVGTDVDVGQLFDHCISSAQRLPIRDHVFQA